MEVTRVSEAEVELIEHDLILEVPTLPSECEQPPSNGPTADDTRKWEMFQAREMRTSIRRARVISKCVAFVLFVQAVNLTYLNLKYNNYLGWGYITIYVAGGAVMVLVAEMSHKFANTWDDTHSIWAACIGQLCLCAVVAYVAECLGLCASHYDEVMPHRIYLTMTGAWFWAAPYLFHMPPRVFACCLCPIYVLGWWHFHYQAAFLNVDIAISPLLYASMMIYLQRQANQEREVSFQATCLLEEEHKLLIATQKALHGMLSSLWDASCTCNVHGIISSSTPHLTQLLGSAKERGRSGLGLVWLWSGSGLAPVWLLVWLPVWLLVWLPVLGRPK